MNEHVRRDRIDWWSSQDKTYKKLDLTQADKQNKLQACTKEEFLLLLKKQTLLFFTNDSQTHLIAAKTLSTQY